MRPRLSRSSLSSSFSFSTTSSPSYPLLLQPLALLPFRRGVHPSSSSSSSSLFAPSRREDSNNPRRGTERVRELNMPELVRDFTPLVNLPVSLCFSLAFSPSLCLSVSPLPSLGLSHFTRARVPLLVSSASHAPAINRLQITGLTALNFSRPPSRSGLSLIALRCGRKSRKLLTG